MKIKYIIIFTAIISIFGCTTNSNQITITGEVINPKNNVIEIRLTDTTYIATLDENSNFRVAFLINEPQYLNFFHGNESTTMYLKGDQEVHIKLNTDYFDETIEYTGSPESDFLAWKYLYIEGDTNHISQSNLIINYHITEGFKSIEDLSLYLDTLYEKIYEKLYAVNNSVFYTEEYQKSEKKIDNILKRHEQLLKIPKAGEPAIDFTYPDQNGKSVSLSDFKGNLIYVDVWATWCGPCVRQIPALKKLEEEYHHHNIISLGVSVDNDKEAWLKMVKEEQLAGVQLWANKGKEIKENYGIYGIPRFMLFDADGNVISTKAPRPSEYKKIKQLIEDNLKVTL